MRAPERRRPPPRPDFGVLAAQLGPGAITVDAADMEAFAHDETEDLRFLPEAVARPASTAEVQTILRFAHQHRIPVTPRGAGTGLSGGALAVTGGLVLALERMHRIREIDTRNLVAVGPQSGARPARHPESGEDFSRKSKCRPRGQQLPTAGELI